MVSPADTEARSGRGAGTMLIVAAMPEELGVLRARLTGATPITVPGARAREAARGALGGRPVVLAATGDGARNAREGIAALLGATAPAELLIVGIAGGLTPDLRAGDLIVASRVVGEGEPDGAPAVVEAGPSGAAAARASGARMAAVVTARRIADCAAEKRRLAGLAGGGTAVVDLETAAYVAAARRAGVAWTVLRAVSDTADESLPALLNQARDDGGAVRRGGVVRGLLRDPGALPALLSLRRRLALCAEALARGATAIATAARAPAPVFVPPTPGTEDRPVAPHPPGALS